MMGQVFTSFTLKYPLLGTFKKGLYSPVPRISRALVKRERMGFLLEAAGFAAKAPSYFFLIVM